MLQFSVCRCETYSWEGTIVPEVALVWEAVSNESELALLDILLDRVEELVFRDLIIVNFLLLVPLNRVCLPLALRLTILGFQQPYSR